MRANKWAHARGRTLIAGLAAITLLGTACGSDEKSAGTTTPPTTAAGSGTTINAGKPLEIGFFVLGAANTFVKAMVEGVNEQAAKRGNVTVTVFDAAFDPTTQLNQIEDATATGKFDGFIIMPVVGAIIQDASASAIKAGIAIVAVNNPIGPNTDTAEPQIDGLVGSIIEDNHGSGAINGQEAIDACAAEHKDADPCKVVYITGGKTLPLEITKRAGFDEKIKGTNLEVVADGEAGFLTDPAVTLMQDILQAHPDVNVVVVGGDEMALGAELALKDAGLAGKVSIIGLGASTQGVQAVKEGRWYSTAAFIPRTEGMTATEMLLGHLDGTPVAKTALFAQDLISTGRTVNKDNVGQFKPEWSI